MLPTQLHINSKAPHPMNQVDHCCFLIISALHLGSNDNGLDAQSRPRTQQGPVNSSRDAKSQVLDGQRYGNFAR